MSSTYTYQFQPELIVGYIQAILTAMPMTIYLVVYSLLFGLVIGFLLALAQIRGSRVVSTIARGYISFIRGIPALVMIFLVFMGLPQVVPGLSKIAKSSFIVASMTLITSANLGEMMRSSYLAVERGQTEAALSVGMTERQALMRIVLPQAIAIAVPTLGNQIIGLFKETSLAFSIGTVDLMGKAQALSSATYGNTRLECYLAVSVVYWICCLAIQFVASTVERMTSRGRTLAKA